MAVTKDETTKNLQPAAWPLMNTSFAMVIAALAGIAIFSSAFHFWPFEQSRLWQRLCPSNFAVLAGCLLLTGYVLKNRTRRGFSTRLPHISIFAYISISILSAAFASSIARSASFTIKLALMLIGGFILLSSAINSAGRVNKFYILTAIAASIAVGSCLIDRAISDSGDCGFFSNPYKYGTYTGILVPLSSIYFLTGRDFRQKAVGAAILIAGLLSSASLGAAAAIAAGIATSTIIIQNRAIKVFICLALIVSAGLVLLLSSSTFLKPLINDTRTTEKDRTNLRQRYIEWQAEINLLEQRSATGTAAGCINDYRSAFYYRLPKLNTLEPFDQNGWVQLAAETGILGLVCFCWIIIYYAGLAYKAALTSAKNSSRTIQRTAAANLAGISAACVANLFSALQYNGVLIVFVLVLVLTAKTNLLIGAR